MPYIPILDEKTGARRLVMVQTNPEAEAIGRRKWAEAEHHRTHGHDEASARGVVEGAARARTHAEAAEIIRSAADRYGGSDAPGDRYASGLIGAESRGIMEQARRAELDAQREAVRARMARATIDRDRDR